MHRDIAPRNIFITLGDRGTQRFKFGDLGCAVPLQDAPRSELLKYSISTAPEILLALGPGANYDAAADIYAVGIVLASIVTLKQYDAGTNDRDQILLAQHQVEADMKKPFVQKRYSLLQLSSFDLLCT